MRNLLTRFDFPLKVSNSTEISFDFITETNCDPIEDNSVIIDQYVPHDNNQLPKYHQMSQQQNMYSNFPFFDDGYNDDMELPPRGIPPVIDSGIA